jgi:hypothetical protein
VPIEAVEHAAREMLRLGDEAVVLTRRVARCHLRHGAADAGQPRQRHAKRPKPRAARSPARGLTTPERRFRFLQRATSLCRADFGSAAANRTMRGAL